MADEQKEPTETTEQTETPTGAFAGMDFEEPDDQELYGFLEEMEEEECEDCEEEVDEEGEYEYYDPDKPEVTNNDDEEYEYEEEQEVQEGLQADLVALAKAQGLSDDEIKSIGSDSALGTIIAALQRRAVEETTESAEIQQSDAALKEIEESRQALAEIQGMKPDDHFDPVAARAIKALNSELERMQGELSKVGGVAFSAQSEQGVTEIAGKYPEVLGSGPSSELDPTSDYSRNRSRLLDEVSILRAGYTAAKKPVPTDTELFTKAFRSVFGMRIQEIERDRFAKKVKKREKQFIARATNNRGVPKKGRDKAVASVAQIMRDRGLVALDSETFE